MTEDAALPAAAAAAASASVSVCAPAHTERACHGLQPVRLRAAAPVARAHDMVEERLRALELCRQPSGSQRLRRDEGLGGRPEN